MKMYYVRVPSDVVGEDAIKEFGPGVEAAGGGITLSRSHGVGDAILVMTLPDEVLPEQVGLNTAEFVMDLPGPEKHEEIDELHTLGTEPGEDE